mmetsp:Transcript_22410/g.30658  ORF Transcript_22410/g.30658 Transcript_22410/m.30658 type:complete len:87 (-) Transcript_22410:17-277(-)
MASELESDLAPTETPEKDRTELKYVSRDSKTEQVKQLPLLPSSPELSSDENDEQPKVKVDAKERLPANPSDVQDKMQPRVGPVGCS